MITSASGKPSMADKLSKERKKERKKEEEEEEEESSDQFASLGW